MGKTSPQLEWCIVRFGEDGNWWVDEISDDVHWHVDGLSIIDPRQLAYIIELIEPLHDHGFDPDILESAFYAFRIDKDLGNGRVRLARANESLFDSDEKLFSLPDIMDEETGPYADFLDHITKLRVKMLNDLISFEKTLTVDELEEQIRDEQNNSFLEGRSVHLFHEIVSILEFVPAGWEIDEEESSEQEEEEEVDDFPDIEDAPEDLANDESLRWDDEEDDGFLDEEKTEEEQDEDDDFSEDDEDDEDDEEDGEEEDR